MPLDLEDEQRLIWAETEIDRLRAEKGRLRAAIIAANQSMQRIKLGEFNHCVSTAIHSVQERLGDALQPNA